jgi:hypothetical protein
MFLFCSVEMGHESEYPGDDNRSEFSAASNMSSASYLSASSAATSRSGASTVSVLSNLSLSSDSQRSGFSSLEKAKSFVIEGLDHTLLSRGSVEDQPTHGKGKKPKKREFSEKQLKKRDRKQRGSGPDVCGLKNECALCQELWALGHSLKSFALEAADLCEALVVIGGHSKLEGMPSEFLDSSLLSSTKVPASTVHAPFASDASLAMLLQKAVDEYALHFRNNSAPVGPSYTSVWLAKKHMHVMSRFQDPAQFLQQASIVTAMDIESLASAHAHAKSIQLHFQATGAGNNSGIGTKDEIFVDGEENPSTRKNWWQVVADGITSWQKLRKSNLALEGC